MRSNKRILVILSVFIACLLVALKHRSFLAYLMDPRVLRLISPGELVQNLIITPVILLLFAVSFYSFGKIIYGSMLDAEARRGYEGAVFIALGMGAANLLFFILGKLSLLYKGAVILYLALGAVLWIYLILKDKEKFVFLLPEKAAGKIFLILAAAGLAYNAVSALSIPVSWDALAYQLSIPKLYAAAHGFIQIPGMKLQQSLSGGEMLNAAALAVYSDKLPQLFSFLSECALIYLMVTLGKSYFSENTVWASAALFAVTPAVLKTGGIAGNDIQLALFVFIAVMYFWEYIANGNTGKLYISALCCGFAAMMKMPGLVTAGFLISILVANIVAKKVKPGAAQLFICAALFVVVTAPIFFQKYTSTGNPVYPFLQQYINPGDTNSVKMAARLNREAAATEGVARTPLNFLLLPYKLVRYSPRFQDTPYYFVIPALLALFLRVASRRKPGVKEIYFSGFIVFYATVWFFAGWQVWRHLLCIMPFMFLLVFEWVEKIKSVYLKTTCSVLFLINAVPLLKADVNNKLFSVFALPSLESPGTLPRDRYLEKTLDHYTVYEYANKYLPSASKVLLFREMRGYYLDVPYIWGDPLNQAEIVYGVSERPEELKKQLDEKLITHVIVNYNIYLPSETYYSAAINRAMNDMLKHYGSEEFKANGVVLYKLKRTKI